MTGSLSSFIPRSPGVDSSLTVQAVMTGSRQVVWLNIDGVFDGS